MVTVTYTCSTLCIRSDLKKQQGPKTSSRHPTPRKKYFFNVVLKRRLFITVHVRQAKIQISLHIWQCGQGLRCPPEKAAIT